MIMIKILKIIKILKKIHNQEKEEKIENIPLRHNHLRFKKCKCSLENLASNILKLENVTIDQVFLKGKK